LLAVTTFNRIAKWINLQSVPNPITPVIDKQQSIRARQIGRVVRAGANYTPWRTNCFPQAITACILLSLYRIPCAMHFGVTGSPGQDAFDAHVWVFSGAISVTGGAGFSMYETVGCFLSRHAWLRIARERQ
jgi:hypothetical protein